MIPISELTLCPIQLRPVRRETLEYLQLRDSIRELGILQSLTCRPRDGILEVYLGAHRFTVAKEERIPEVPCIIRDATDAEVQRLQIEENAQRIDTTNVEYARRLWRIVEVEKTLTLPELAQSLHRSLSWTRRMLKLVQLCPEAETQLAENQLSLRIAMELAKLPYQDQLDLLPLVGSVPTAEAVELIQRKARHFRQGSKNTRVARRLNDTKNLEPIFRTRGELLHELDSPTMMASVFDACEARTDAEKWKATLKFVLQLDPLTLQKRLNTGDSL